MDGIYLPDGRQLALIDRDWILDELPHLGNPADNSDANYLLASSAAANCSPSSINATSAARATSTISTGAGASHGTPPHITGRGVDITGTGGTTGVNTYGTSINHNHSLTYNPEESESDLTLLSEIVDETQDKWSDFGLNQLVTPYARTSQRLFK